MDQIKVKIKVFINNISKDQVKNTGMAMVLILLLVGFFSKNTIFFKIGIPVLVINMVIPNIYKPIAIIWLGVSYLLGTIVSRIILTMVYFVVVTPIGLFRRMLGIDSLKLNKFKNGRESVMEIRDITFSRNEIEKPF